jgi:hypothetical protein
MEGEIHDANVWEGKVLQCAALLLSRCASDVLPPTSKTVNREPLLVHYYHVQRHYPILCSVHTQFSQVSVLPAKTIQNRSG